MKSIIFYLCIFGLLLTSCQPFSESGIELTSFPTFTVTHKTENTSTSVLLPADTPTLTPDIDDFLRNWKLGDLSLIAFKSGITDTTIFLMSSDGSNIVTILDSQTIDIDSGSVLSWSPDGRHIAFSGTAQTDILILSIEEGYTENITNTPDIDETGPAWSPDGNRIAFTSRRFGSTRNINIMDQDGSNIEQLTDCPVDCWYPTWSPTGETIAFIYSGYDSDDIYSIKVDGSNQKQLTHEGSNLYPAWSPDGRFIAFTRSYASSTTYLYLMTPAGTNLVALTGDSVAAGTMSWSPDGKSIAFINYTGSDSKYSLGIIELQSGEIQQYSFNDDYISSPAWMPAPTSHEIVPQSNCAAGWTRLVAGEQARVAGAPTDPPNRVRSGPIKSDNVIGYITPGTILTVLEGPVCADGLVFWLVSSDSIPGGSGWTAEGDGTEYYLEPYTP